MSNATEWAKMKEQARALDVSEQNRHADVSRRNQHVCTDCFTCACWAVVAPDAFNKKIDAMVQA